MSSKAGGEATKALKRTTGQKFHVSRQKRAEHKLRNYKPMTRKQGQQHIKKQRQNKRATRKLGVQRIFKYEEEEEDDFPKLKF